MSPDQLHDYRLEQASSVKLPYIGLAIALLVLGLVIARFKLPVIAAVEPHGKVHDSIWKYPRLVMGAIGIFVYVGAEVAIGSMLVNYMSQPNIGNISIQLAAKFVSLYWGGAMIGRFIGSAVLQKVRTGTVLGFSALMAFLLVALSMGSFGHLGDVEHPVGGLLQFDDVPQHFYSLHRGTWAVDGQRLRFAGLRHRGRRRSFQSCRACLPTISASIMHSFCPRCVICTSRFSRSRAISRTAKRLRILNGKLNGRRPSIFHFRRASTGIPVFSLPNSCTLLAVARRFHCAEIRR